MSYEEKLKYVSVVATPIASKKFAKKIYKLIKKGSKQKTYVRSGLKVKNMHFRFWSRHLNLKKSPIEEEHVKFATVPLSLLNPLSNPWRYRIQERGDRFSVHFAVTFLDC